MELFFSGIALGVLFNEAWRRSIFGIDRWIRTRRSS